MEKKALRTVFIDILNNKPVDLTKHIIKKILKRDLRINMKQIDDPVKKILPVFMAHYMTNWPGWQLHHRKKITEDDLYIKFQKYMELKINFAIREARTHYLEADDRDVDQIEHEVNVVEELFNKLNTVAMADTETQTDVSEIVEAPFGLNIKCPAEMLENLCFFNTKGDNIGLSTHTPVKVENLTMRNLMNWPQTSIRFYTKEFCFNRISFLEKECFLTLVNVRNKIKRKPFIDSVSIIDSQTKRKVFSTSIFEYYITQLMPILKKIPSYLMSEDKYEDIRIILESFLKDIEEIDIQKSIATNTSVCFHIGKFIYTRYKQSERSDVMTCENITPRLNLELYDFQGKQDMEDTNMVSFENLNALQRMIERKDNLDGFIPHITFRCITCNWSFESKLSFIAHLEQTHTLPLNVMCSDCSQCYSVPDLTTNRWGHMCQNTNAEAPAK